LGGASTLALAACGETVVERVEVPVEVIKEVQVAGETVVQEVEVVKEVEVPGETVVKEVEVVKEVPVEVVKEVEVFVPAEAEKVTISTSHSWPEHRYQEQIDFDDLFMGRHPNIEIDRRNTVWAEYWTKTFAQAAAGTLPDVFYNQDTRIAAFLSSDSYIGLTDYMRQMTDGYGWENDFVDLLKPIVTRDGEVYAIPYDWGGPVLSYNKAYFDDAGSSYPDASWMNTDVLEFSKEVTVAEDRKWGFAYRYWGNWGHEGIYNRQFGGRWISDDELEISGVMDSAETLASNEFWSNFALVDKVTPNPADEEALGVHPMTGGHVAMYHAPPWQAAGFNDNPDLDWDIAPSESGPEGQFGAALGSNYGIAKNTEHPDAAWQYLSEYMSTEGMNYMWTYQATAICARKSAQLGFPSAPGQPDGVQHWIDAVNTYLVPGKPLSENSNEILRINGEIMRDMILGATTLQEATAQAVEEIEPLLVGL
jgi:multiple sugar transport system substrate-binding protein